MYHVKPQHACCCAAAACAIKGTQQTWLMTRSSLTSSSSHKATNVQQEVVKRRARKALQGIDSQPNGLLQWSLLIPPRSCKVQCWHCENSLEVCLHTHPCRALLPFEAQSH
jgi:hypothetical protein